MTVRSREVTTLPEYVSLTDEDDPFVSLVLYRGQPVQGNLLPSVARKRPKRDTTATEKRVLEQLQLLGASHLVSAGATTLDHLVLAQHFGLRTRLLDWTSNPLAALWFACSDSSAQDAYVYALNADVLLEKDVYSKDPFATARTRVFQPRLNNSRIAAQDGWFTLHRYSVTVKRFVPLEENSETRQYLQEVKIPAQWKESMLYSLERHGVSSRTLFPDLVGLCASLNKRYLDV